MQLVECTTTQYKIMRHQETAYQLYVLSILYLLLLSITSPFSSIQKPHSQYHTTPTPHLCT